MVSNEFFKLWRGAQTVSDVFGREVKLGGKFSFCFIDGDHQYTEAKQDFQNCNDHLDPDALILFDDSAKNSGWGGVQRLVEEVRASGSYEIVMRNPNYLMRKIDK